MIGEFPQRDVALQVFPALSLSSSLCLSSFPPHPLPSPLSILIPKTTFYKEVWLVFGILTPPLTTLSISNYISFPISLSLSVSLSPIIQATGCKVRKCNNNSFHLCTTAFVFFLHNAQQCSFCLLLRKYGQLQGAELWLDVDFFLFSFFSNIKTLTFQKISS